MFLNCFCRFLYQSRSIPLDLEALVLGLRRCLDPHAAASNTAPGRVSPELCTAKIRLYPLKPLNGLEKGQG